MRAILIDPFAKQVTEVDYKGPYTNIYKFLTPPPPYPAVDTFTVIQVDGVNSIYVDDEGLLKQYEGEDKELHNMDVFFEWKGYEQPLAGKGLILGVDEEGETIVTTLTVEHVKSMVTFRHDIELDRLESFEGMVDHPMMGRVPIIGNRPIFKSKS